MKRIAFADLHQHLLWGLDDGAQTPGQMRALLNQNARQGVEIICATVHADLRRAPLDCALYQRRLAEANAYCAQHQLPVRILPGCEIMYSAAVPDWLMQGKLFPLGDSRYVLIEFPGNVSIPEIEDAANGLYRSGYRPILAHVERYRALVSAPKRAMALRDEYGLIYQMDCSTVLRPRSLRMRYFAYRMLRAQAIDLLASDAHNAGARPVRMRAAYRCIAEKYGARYARRLTCAGRELIGAPRGE